MMYSDMPFDQFKDRIAEGLSRTGDLLSSLCSGTVTLNIDPFIGYNCVPDSDDLMPFLTRAFCGVSQYFQGSFGGAIQCIFLNHTAQHLYTFFCDAVSDGMPDGFIEAEVLREVGNVVCSAVLSCVLHDAKLTGSSLPELSHGNYEMLLGGALCSGAQHGFLINVELTDKTGVIHKDKMIVIVSLQQAGMETVSS